MGQTYTKETFPGTMVNLNPRCEFLETYPLWFLGATIMILGIFLPIFIFFFSPEPHIFIQECDVRIFSPTYNARIPSVSKTWRNNFARYLYLLAAVIDTIFSYICYTDAWFFAVVLIFILYLGIVCLVNDDNCNSKMAYAHFAFAMVLFFVIEALGWIIVSYYYTWNSATGITFITLQTVSFFVLIFRAIRHGQNTNAMRKRFCQEFSLKEESLYSYAEAPEGASEEKKKRWEYLTNKLKHDEWDSWTCSAEIICVVFFALLVTLVPYGKFPATVNTVPVG